MKISAAKNFGRAYISDMNLLVPYVTLESVRINIDASSRKRVFEEASLLFESAYGLAHSETFDALIARERLGSTCVGAGCAIPHGRLEGAREPSLVFLRTTEPVMLDAPDGRGVQLFVCLIIPEDDGSNYLSLLRECAALLNDRSMRQMLLEASDETEICRMLHDWTPPEDLHSDFAQAWHQSEDGNEEDN